MFTFIFVVLLLLAIGLVISGSQKLTQEVRTNMAPENIEQLYNELTNRKQIGQIILVILAIIIMFIIT